MGQSQFPIDKYVLRALGIKEEPFKAIEKRSVDFQKAKLIKLAEALRPFLFEESEAELVAGAHIIIPGLIGKYM